MLLTRFVNSASRTTVLSEKPELERVYECRHRLKWSMSDHKYLYLGTIQSACVSSGAGETMGAHAEPPET